MNTATQIKPLYPDYGSLLSYQESVKSATAIRRGIANVPTTSQYYNMKALYLAIYVPICAKFGKLPVSSMFRSYALNKAIGGSATSAHLDGRAIDIDCDGLSHVSNTELYEWVKKNLTVDQVIKEGYDAATGQASWVHIGISQAGKLSRNQHLIMVRRAGQTIYLPDDKD